ncbi:hypothetical protein [Variovorax guangxiensis]|uniref:DUF7674 family protein n=1 Tax=Variovorax guangxiensis TaxID=1775474 RepID=UPI00285B2A88|nr:hypothetical protein [Variovorax guangxiensis]MDR6860071.1 hypothetical protein [Variovorax guangxiensis]
MDHAVAFINQLIEEVPELAEAHRRHIADFDLLLPHVFMAEIARFVVTSTTNFANSASVTKILTRLEQGLQSGDASVAELIGVSFVESFSNERTALERLLPQLGDALRREVKSIFGV